MAARQPEDSDKAKFYGKVKKILPGSEYLITVNISGDDHDILGYISGKMRRHYIKLAKGDDVEVEISVYDPEKCRITYRYRPGQLDKLLKQQKHESTS